MRIELTVFEDENQTKRGLLRALASMCFIAIFSFLWFALIKKQLPKDNKAWIGAIMVFVLLGTAIAIQFPNNSKTAVTYGAILGLLVYGVANGMLLVTSGTCPTLTPVWVATEIARGTVATALTAFLVYRIFF
jgi:4-amino-4-deoxy-L-arabinose transferase-like glycosyltransferase